MGVKLSGRKIVGIKISGRKIVGRNLSVNRSSRACIELESPGQRNITSSSHGDICA